MATTETLRQHPIGAFTNIDDPQQVGERFEIEYVPEQIPEFNCCSHCMYADFKQIFEKFRLKETKAVEEVKKDDVHHRQEGSNSDEDYQQTQEKGVSNKKKKRVKMSVAKLKQMCLRPDVVEVWDTTAADPKLLVRMKSYRNTVPVPRHWSQKRKYLQGTRGVEKRPFQLPDYIAATGIMQFREAYIEKQDSKNLKQKQRERLQPKTGKMDIDYQKLHDAFFKNRVKPSLTTLGDLYYEGKEFGKVEKMDRIKPGGMLSHEIKEALGMSSEGAPPPWLINMQRYGPPPSYPHLKIPGLNAPIPAGASFGYHPSGWGKPPVNEYGQPLYGNVFGVGEQPKYEEEQVEKMKHWGELEEEDEEEEDEEEEDEEDEEKQEEKDLDDDKESVDPSEGADQTVPDVIELRKQQRKETGETPLYQVLEEKEERIAAGTLLGTSHTYVVGGGSRDDKAGVKRVDLLRGHKADKVEVTLQPEELEAMENVLPEKYQQAREEENLRRQPEDFSDMVAEDAERKRKRKMQEKDAKSNKKHKQNHYKF